MKLLEIERKFTWNPASLNILLSNGGQPPFSSRPTIQSKIFRDTYYDLDNRLSSKGLWVRKRFYNPHKQDDRSKTGMWEAKQSMPGSSFVRSTYDETQDPIRIWQMVKNCVPKCAGPNESFGLEETCRFVTHRRSFLADGKFIVVLDETDFGHSAGEVELLAEDANKAHADIDVFLARYAWLFDCSKPKGKLTAYFEKYPRNNV
ncbi:uncharacterized protein KY384_005283 [Bacidia gigantensis]|uniref:uncharacterized protein n=1 Tax=Bacidia gigantensis TaxID=2732470 RepID=UPI001D05A0F9|nr:uncharacterized protein KY384_005283 [Bacidia gigantensis]KAG8529802.1 hypothetical protein KY384_005283 [Bacidia gigantensis]